MNTKAILDFNQEVLKVRQDGIEQLINLIETKGGSSFKADEFSNIYDLIFKMCIQRDPHNYSQLMYDEYTASIGRYIEIQTNDKLRKAKQKHGIVFLQVWQQRWQNHKLIVHGLSKLFMYLDRFFTVNTDGILTLKKQGFQLFKEKIFDKYQKYARDIILDMIDKERRSETQDRILLRNAVLCFTELGFECSDKKLEIYKVNLEMFVITHAGEFYKRQTQLWIEEDSCANYLFKAEKMINLEKNRVHTYLVESTLEPLVHECYVQLLQVHLISLFKKNTGIDFLLMNNAIDDLQRIYRLYKKYPEDLEKIADMMQEHISKKGTKIVDESKDQEDTLVSKLIELHDSYLKIVRDSLEGDSIFQKALKKGFEHFINRDTRVSNLLAKFISDVLKKGGEINIQDLESILDNVVFIYGYIHEKDIFERNYQLFLAFRLLNNQCKSEHSEKTMISKLKTECGYAWTNKLETMFKDIQQSQDMLVQFKEQSDRKVDLNVSVCTTGSWPSSKMILGNIPLSLKEDCKRYREYYIAQHSGRKLDWRLDQGRAEIQVSFSPCTTITLVTSTFQMMILLCFNNKAVVTLKEIIHITGVSRHDITNHLLTLCHPKINILNKRPGGRSLAEDHMFRINGKYTNKLKKVIVPVINATTTSGAKTEQEETMMIIKLQRRHQIDASIVRIMKTRKTLTHNILVSEVMMQLKARFKPQPNIIKKRVEALIEQEYLERDTNNRGTYNYLA
jgi:cullin 1